VGQIRRPRTDASSMRGLTNRCGIRRQAANGLPERTGRNQQLARAIIVTWDDRRVGHVVDTTPKSPVLGRAAKKSLGNLDRRCCRDVRVFNGAPQK
jgi:hypothetical protein